MLAAVLVGQVRGHADLARSTLHGALLDLELLEREQLGPVPQAADADVELVAEVDLDRVEPEVGAELAGEIRPAMELRPVALAAPRMIAMADAIERHRGAAQRHGARDAAALLDVAGKLVARRRRVLVRRARRLPAQGEGGPPV